MVETPRIKRLWFVVKSCFGSVQHGGGQRRMERGSRVSGGRAFPVCTLLHALNFARLRGRTFTEFCAGRPACFRPQCTHAALLCSPHVCPAAAFLRTAYVSAGAALLRATYDRAAARAVPLRAAAFPTRHPPATALDRRIGPKTQWQPSRSMATEILRSHRITPRTIALLIPGHDRRRVTIPARVARRMENTLEAGCASIRTSRQPNRSGRCARSLVSIGFSRSSSKNLVNRLHQLDQMPPEQRARTMDRIENLERLSPERRQAVRSSAQQLAVLPQDRKRMVQKAFRDLREMPPEQRQAVMNSPQFAGQFSAQERSIMGNLLAVEPYQHAGAPVQRSRNTANSFRKARRSLQQICGLAGELEKSFRLISLLP